MSTPKTNGTTTKQIADANRRHARSILGGLNINADAANRLADQLGLPRLTVERAAAKAAKCMDREP